LRVIESSKRMLLLLLDIYTTKKRIMDEQISSQDIVACIILLVDVICWLSTLLKNYCDLYIFKPFTLNKENKKSYFFFLRSWYFQNNLTNDLENLRYSFQSISLRGNP